MSKIESFNNRFKKTKVILEQKLGKNDPDVLAQALDGLEVANRTLSWLPNPSSPGGTGPTDEDSKRNAGGIRR